VTVGFGNKGIEPSGSICIRSTWGHISVDRHIHSQRREDLKFLD